MSENNWLPLITEKTRGLSDRNSMNQRGSGGGRGIRTPDTLSGISVFKTDCFNRSHIPPRGGWYEQFTSSRKATAGLTFRGTEEAEDWEGAGGTVRKAGAG